MPVYDHLCLTCGHEFEISYSIHEEPEVPCPQCGKKTRRVISGTPHVRLNWLLATSRDDGHDELVLHPARRGVASPKSESAKGRR